MSTFDLKGVCAHFFPEGTVQHVLPLGEGFINDTFTVSANDGKQYLLQRKNKNIFVNVPEMMNNIDKVTRHIKQKLTETGGDPERETLTLVPALDGKLYHLDREEEYWAVCVFIEDSRNYEKVESLHLAYSGGKGVGKFQRMLVDFHEPLTDILPGFHNIRYRFEQWDKVIAADRAERNSTMKKEIGWIEDRRTEMLAFWELVETGVIPTRVVHNDTKISNILFGPDGEVLCMIDLDTVQQSTVLNDFGDAIRSYANTGLEDEKDLSKVNYDAGRYEAFTKGYLEEAAGFLTKAELDYLAFAARYITFEQVLRFLMDYLDGDRYYRIRYPEHNFVRTLAQYKLLQDFENHFDEMKTIVTRYA